VSRGAAIAEVFRTALDATDRLDPIERDATYRAIVADLRSRCPASVSSLALEPPTEPITDAPGRR
jgi:hypothetical protein